MLVIGLILVLIALVVVGFMSFGTASLDTIEMDLWVLTANLNPLEIFGLGALSIAVLAIGLLFVATGLRRQRRKRKELQELRLKAEQADRSAPRHDVRSDARPPQPTPAPSASDREVPRGGPDAARSGDRVATDRDRMGPGADGRDGQVNLPMDRRRPGPDGDGR